MDYTIHPEVINIAVDYVHKCESPHQFYVELQCASRTIKMLFDNSSGSINNVPSNEQCILLVTDGDAMNSINETTPFNGTVMTLTIADDNTSSPITPSPDPSIGFMFSCLVIGHVLTLAFITIEPTTSDQLQLIIIFIGGSIGGVCIVIFIVIGELPMALV